MKRLARLARSAALPLTGALAALLLLARLPAPAAAAPETVAGGIRFSYAQPHAGAVHWVGDFNGWNTTANAMTKDANGVWSIVLALPAGEHQYKFFADGSYVPDPENPATAGEYGNSLVRVGANGELLATRATSNTPYSPKIGIGGRVIGLYQAIDNPATDRFELRRPEMDIDLNFDIRVSDALAARFLMNIHSETEDVQFFRSRLNFDRGRLLLTRPRFSVLAWDNESIGTWDDPLHLMGDIGIYRYGFGYRRQGFRVTAEQMGFEVELDYADNFDPGGGDYALFSDADSVSSSLGTRDSLRAMRDGNQYVLDPAHSPAVLRASTSDNNENTVALRVRRALPMGFTAGLLGRADRGFHLGTGLIQRVTGPTTFQQMFGTFEQQWFAGGGEVAWKGPMGFGAWGEVLRGRLRLSLVDKGNTPSISDFTATAVDSTGIAGADLTGVRAALGEHTDLDRSDRFAIGGSWAESHGDIVVRAGLEYQDHAYRILQHGIENSMRIWRLDWDRNWRYYLGREVKTTVGLEFTDFEYDRRTRWDYQLWFPNGNFWLESGEHVVRFDRLTMLGGNDVATSRLALAVPIPELRARAGPVRLDNALLEYRGLFNAASFGRRPRYVESIFRFGVDLTSALRLTTDSRWAKYDDPGLGLFGGYLSHFGELQYRFAPGIDIAFSLGVDPNVVDPVTNEYAAIGRDLFLFARGANAGTAESDYYALRETIVAAERALRAERRVQIKANVVF